MKYELTSPMYILFAELANFEVDTDQRLERFLKENVDQAKGISKKYILEILEQAFLDGETLNVKLVGKEVAIRSCLDWIKRKRADYAEITSFKPEAIDKNEERKYVIQNGKPKFSHTYIVLKCFYKGIEITNDNSKRIAKIYDYVAINSGKKLKDLFDYYRSDQSRTSYPGPRKFKSMINDLESIIKYLPQEKWKQGNPLDDLQKLKSNGAGYEKHK